MSFLMEYSCQDSRTPLVNLTEAERKLAFERYKIIRSHLEDGKSLLEAANQENISLRTARYWAKNYCKDGLLGLVRKSRCDKNTSQFAPSIRDIIEGFALQLPKPSVSTVHRKALLQKSIFDQNHVSKLAENLDSNMRKSGIFRFLQQGPTIWA